MAYPERLLARILKVRLEKLQPVLQKLNTARVLRDDHRPEGTWYELYHDVFAEIIETWNRNFQTARRRLRRIVVCLCLLGLLISLTIFGYRQYQIALNLGTLEVKSPAGAALSLTCVRHYGENAGCQDDVQNLETSVRLAGPADYMLTAQHGTSWTLRYPVYIHGYGHRVAVRVYPPPASVPDSMAYIPGGVFRMGDKDDRDVMGGGNEQPHHDAYVDGFFMDQYEVTNAQYQQCVDAGVCARPHYDDGTCYHPIPLPQGDRLNWDLGQVDPAFQEASKPVVCVDWEQAQAYCKFVRKRLPTEAEWEKAATGPEGYTWSCGNTLDGARLNYCDKQCDFQWQDKQADDGYRWTAPIGSYAEGGYGLYDMSGNVWEWVEDWYDGQFYSTPEAEKPNPVNTTKGKEGWRVAA